MKRKTLLLPFIIYNSNIKYFFRIMRISLFLLFVCVFQLMAEEADAQNAEIKLSQNSMTIKQLVKEIEAQTDYLVVFRDQDVDVNKTVSFNTKTATVADYLEMITKNTGISYQFENNYITLLSTSSKSVNQEKKKKISGQIVDTYGLAVIGANVVEKGTTNGTITDVDGNFSLEVDENSTLVVSYIGYTPQEIIVANKSNFSIKLKEDTEVLDEVVVVGYGTAKKKNLTGAVSSVKAEKLSAQAPRNVQDILRSNAAGLNIGIATDAKAEADLSVRGKGTLSAGSSPLIVLDGVIYEGNLSDITPEDIASVDVLKDASSSAVYGAKAANGVIAITTKKGIQGKPVINFNANISFAKSANQPKILDAEGFLKFRQDYNEGRNSDEYLAKYPQIFVNPFKLQGVDPLVWYNYDQSVPATSVTDKQLETQWLSRLNLLTPEIDNYFAGRITKWDDLVFQTGLQQDYTVSVSNATERTSQYYSLNWADREGIITGDKYTNFRARMNVKTEITSFLSVGMNAQFSSRNEGFLKCLWEQMTMISPYGANEVDNLESPYRRNPTGMDPVNPFYDNMYTERKDLYQNLNAKLYAEVKLPFGIEYTLNFTPYYSWHDYYNHYSSEGEKWEAIGGASVRTNTKQFSWQIDNIIRWKREFAQKHKVEVTLLANAEKAQYWSTTAEAQGYTPNDVLGYHQLQSGSVQKVSSDDTYQTGDALMARLFYSFNNKYMLTTSIRRDGYSAFGKKNPRATFPSVALGWVFTQEQFMQQANSWLNYAKLRISWGENGNRDIGQYAALAQMKSSLRPYIDQTGNIYTISQMFVNTMANHNLKWERTAAFNFGLDFSLFDELLSGSIETYVSKTNDLLVKRALPDVTGFNSVTANLGQLQNKGFELTLNANIINSKDFKWFASGNFSLNRRKINSLYGDMVDVLDENGNVIGQKESDDETNKWFIGQDPDRIWDYERAGVWQKDEREEAAIYGCQPGDFKYVDQNGDGIMNNKDKVFQGYTTPRFRWTLRNEWTYKNLSLSAVLYSYLGHYGAFQRAANNYSFPDRTSDYDFPRWTATNPINDYARIGSKNIGTNYVNKSFVRLENVTLSYHFPKEWINKFAIQSLRLSGSIQNAAVFAPHWNFWDPESGSVTPRTFNLGINVTL